MKINMKIAKPLLFGATLVVTFATSQNLQATNLAAASAVASASVHRLVVASPHALEEFPWLLRETPGQTETTVRSNRALEAIKKNRALAGSPRMREEFPELARAGQPQTAAASERSTELSQRNQVLKNRAWAASPRVKEEFPWLTRGYTTQTEQTPYQVAPVK
jgi:hypothetical protein